MEESMHVGEQETSLQDQSYHTIRRKIVYLDYKPGEKLGVKQLCDDLDMGRTPVREALVRLALIISVPLAGLHYCHSTALYKLVYNVYSILHFRYIAGSLMTSSSVGL